jgi:hypothetical protein
VELLLVTFVDHHTAAVPTERQQWGGKLPVHWADRSHPMNVASMVLPRLPTRALGFFDRLPLRERSSLALARSAAVLQQLLQIGDAGIACGQRLGGLRDPFNLRLDKVPKGNDLGSHLRGEVSVIARRQVTLRNSQRYARSSFTGWTPAIVPGPDPLGDGVGEFFDAAMGAVADPLLGDLTEPSFA